MDPSSGSLDVWKGVPVRSEDSFPRCKSAAGTGAAERSRFGTEAGPKFACRTGATEWFVRRQLGARDKPYAVQGGVREPTDQSDVAVRAALVAPGEAVR